MILLSIVSVCGTLQLAEREDHVLALIREFEVEQQHTHLYGTACFEHCPATSGDGPIVVARWPVWCAIGILAPDRQRMVELARELFGIYGLEGRKGATGPLARLDGVDLERRVGFELLVGELHLDGREDDLSREELAALTAQGFSLHVANLASYIPIEDDVFTTTLAYLAGVVEFLNGATEGDDVDLGGLLLAREARLELPVGERLELAEGMSVEVSRGPPFYTSFLLDVPATGTARLHFPGAEGFGPPKPFTPPVSPALFGIVVDEDRALRGSTLGAPSALLIPMLRLGPDIAHERYPAAVERARVLQERPGAEPLVHAARSLNLFLPGTFDLARPFVVELELAPGRYRVESPQVGGSARLQPGSSSEEDREARPEPGVPRDG